MRQKMTISPEQEKVAYALFNDALPYYHSTAAELPAMLKLRLALNGYGSAWAACVDIANHYLYTPKLKLEANTALVRVQNFVELT